MLGIPSRDTDPDYINDEGIKWWHYLYATKVLRSKDNMVGVPLPQAAAWLIETPDGEASYVITEEDDILHDGQTLEGLFVKIDVLRKARE